MSDEKIKVILAVNGGVVSDVLIPDRVTIEIRDYDVGVDGNFKTDDEGDEYKEIIFEG
jgi:hypothetical protein